MKIIKKDDLKIHLYFDFNPVFNFDTNNDFDGEGYDEPGNEPIPDDTGLGTQCDTSISISA